MQKTNIFSAVVIAMLMIAMVLNILGDFDWLYVVAAFLVGVWGIVLYQQRRHQLFAVTAFIGFIVSFFAVVLMGMGWH